jgi:hypothetical protein
MILEGIVAERDIGGAIHIVFRSAYAPRAVFWLPTVLESKA